MYYNGHTFRLDLAQFELEPDSQHWIWTKVPLQRLSKKALEFDINNCMLWLRKCHPGNLHDDHFIPGGLVEVDRTIKDAFGAAIALRGLPSIAAEGLLERHAVRIEERFEEMMDEGLAA
jgi:hypothetical protein